MNLLAFLLVAAALILGIIVALMNRRTPAGAGFLLGLAVALGSAGVIIQCVFIDWSHSVHS